MHISFLPLLASLPPILAATLTLRLPSPPSLPNPNALPPSTHATLSTLGQPPYTAPLTTANTFVFRNVSSGSYLADIHCQTFAFAPLRVDVVVAETTQGDGKEEEVVKVWETFRGNDWDNKGEQVQKDGAGYYEVRVLGVKGYFMERSTFSILSILKNPMILLGLVSCVIFMGMPYLVDSMDPEMKAEWEERQKSNPMNGIMGAATGQPGANPMQNFDMASFLAGSSKKDNSPAAPSPPAGAAGSYADVVKSDTPSGGGGGGGGKKKGKR
ncbi:hypothetical protein GE09DRAFT_273590 [Coniochaeta sp. 2T2.1]|nr:hypothetical protein GE09DRAFT_273590 [Coniochaeta sp. 2T2.1]